MTVSWGKGWLCGGGKSNPGPIHVLLEMDHAHLMPEHVAESTDLSSQLRLMSSMFGGQHVLVG